VRRQTRMDQQPPAAAGPSPSWRRVIRDTITLWWARRRHYRRQRDRDLQRFRLRVVVLFSLVVLAAGLLINALSESANLLPDAASIPAPTSDSQQNDDLAGSARRTAPESSRAIPSRTASVARAAAGAEIAARADIDVSPSAATVLREEPSTVGCSSCWPHWQRPIYSPR
jgi:hypothetical protein